MQRLTVKLPTGLRVRVASESNCHYQVSELIVLAVGRASGGPVVKCAGVIWGAGTIPLVIH